MIPDLCHCCTDLHMILFVRTMNYTIDEDRSQSSHTAHREPALLRQRPQPRSHLFRLCCAQSPIRAQGTTRNHPWPHTPARPRVPAVPEPARAPKPELAVALELVPVLGLRSYFRRCAVARTQGQLPPKTAART